MALLIALGLVALAWGLSVWLRLRALDPFDFDLKENE